MQWSFTASLLQPPWPEAVEPAPPPAQRAKLLSQRGAHEWEATSWEKFSANVCSMALKYSADLWAINEHLRHNSSLSRGRWPPVSCGSQSNKYRVLDYKPRVLPVGSLLPAPLSSSSSGSFSLVPFIHLSQCFWFKHMALLTKIPSPLHQQAERPRALRTSHHFWWESPTPSQNTQNLYTVPSHQEKKPIYLKICDHKTCFFQLYLKIGLGFKPPMRVRLGLGLV